MNPLATILEAALNVAETRYRVLREQGPEAFEASLVTPTSNYWRAKFYRRIDRDDQVTADLRAAGWTVLRYWESEVKADLARIVFEVARHLA